MGTCLACLSRRLHEKKIFGQSLPMIPTFAFGISLFELTEPGYTLVHFLPDFF